MVKRGQACGAGNDVGQFGEHLAAVAHAQAKGALAGEELAELVGQHVVERDAACPADAGAQRVAVAETAAGDHTLEVAQVGAAHLQVGHVHVKRFKTGLREGVGHFHMGVHALLAQDGHFRAGASVDERRGHVVGRVEAERHVHARVLRASPPLRARHRRRPGCRAAG